MRWIIAKLVCYFKGHAVPDGTYVLTDGYTCSRCGYVHEKVEWQRTDMEKQRRSFAYGNVNLSNEYVTRHDIDIADDSMKDGE